MFCSNKFFCGWVNAKASWVAWMYVNNGTKDNVEVHEILVEGLGWEVYVARCLHTIQCMKESHAGEQQRSHL